MRATAPAPKKKMSFGEKNELKKLDAEVPALEKKKEDLVARIAANGSDHHAVMKLSLELEQTVKELEKKGERWLELMEKAEQTA